MAANGTSGRRRTTRRAGRAPSAEVMSRRTAIGLIAAGLLVVFGKKVVEPAARVLSPLVPESIERTVGREVDRLTVHHTASPGVVGGRTVDAELLAKWHRERGLGTGSGDARDCAYHLVISPDGSITAGRPLESPSAGTRSLDNNRRSIDVVLVGDFEPSHNRGRYSPAKPTSAQLAALDSVALWAAREFDFAADAVRSHREVTPGKTACPGKRVDMKSIRTRLESSLERGRKAETPEPLRAKDD